MQLIMRSDLLRDKTQDHSGEIFKEIQNAADEISSDPVENNMFTELLLMIVRIVTELRRIDSSAYKPWIDVWPTSDLTNMIYWDKEVLAQIDSWNLVDKVKRINA